MSGYGRHCRTQTNISIGDTVQFPVPLITEPPWKEKRARADAPAEGKGDGDGGPRRPEQHVTGWLRVAARCVCRLCLLFVHHPNKPPNRFGPPAFDFSAATCAHRIRDEPLYKQCSLRAPLCRRPATNLQSCRCQPQIQLPAFFFVSECTAGSNCIDPIGARRSG